MSKINNDSLILTLDYLRFEDVLILSTCNKRLHSLASQESSWEKLCNIDWGLFDTLLNPPGDFNETCDTYKKLYIRWRRVFKEYQVSDVKFVRLWWRSIEKLLASCAPPIFSTLGNQMPQEQIREAESNRTRTPLPYPKCLKLLYSFHNGQSVPIRSKHYLYFSGLFGGYYYYQDFTCMMFLPLHKVTVINDPVSQEPCYVFSECSVQGPMRRLCCSESGNVYITSGCRLLRPCHPLPDTIKKDHKHMEKKTIMNGLFIWLEEYLNRLQDGIYKYAPSPYEHNILSLYPSGGEGVGDGERFGVTTTLSSHISSGSIVTAVTSGIEITVSVVFIPEKSSLDSRRLFWAYSITLRLLADHPSRPTALTQCQLHSRHWKIEFPDEELQEVTGEGVVGQQPILDVSSAQDRPFTYQSCTEGRGTSPGKMYGTFTFVPGTIAAPTGPNIIATIPAFDLLVPKFIY